MCTVEKRRSYKVESVPDPVFYAKERFEIEGAQIGGLVMGFICAATGGGVIALHYCVNKQIPMPLGIFFIVGGLLAMLTTFSSVAVVKVFAIPFMFGLLFAGFSVYVCLFGGAKRGN